MLLLSEAIENLDPGLHCRRCILKMLQAARGAQRKEDDEARVYTWRAVDTTERLKVLDCYTLKYIQEI